MKGNQFAEPGQPINNLLHRRPPLSTRSHTLGDCPVHDGRRRVRDIDGLPPADNLQQQYPEAKHISLSTQVIRGHIEGIKIPKSPSWGCGQEPKIIDMTSESQPKIAQTSIEVPIYQHVSRLYVPVNYRWVLKMKGLDGLGDLQGQPNPATPIQDARIGMKDVVERTVAHELDDQEAVLGVAREADEVDQPGALDLGQDLELVVHLAGDLESLGGLLDGHVAAAEEGLVDVTVAAFAQQLLVGEAIGGRLEVAVVELLNLDRPLSLLLERALVFGRRRRQRRRSTRVGGGNGGFSFARKITHHRKTEKIGFFWLI
ncbi:hypothetical protein BT93_G2405 [Corymbia citriodora subsp. variegata]|nr:hypothetical protein BT93_G2405 [Corymbia citriodora subsp. variegata]